MKISPARLVRGTIRIPGDKSISHRAAMIGAMAIGETRVRNYAPSNDCASTLDCLSKLGVDIRIDGSDVFIKGVGKTGFRRAADGLDCGNSGTTMRLLAGLLAGQSFESTLTGDSSLRTRPMKRIIEPLDLMGAKIASMDGRAPLTINGSTPLRAIEYRPPVASAQIKSCILLAGLNSDGITSVVEADGTRDHTERMLRWFGVDVANEETESGIKISVSGASVLKARELTVPSDLSSAAFLLTAAAGLPGSDISLAGIGVNPSRRAFLDVLVQLGSAVELGDENMMGNEPVATLRLKNQSQRAEPAERPVLNGAIIANLIDEVPILAILGTQLPAGLEIRGAAELRVKESDRINSIVVNLRRMGAKVSEFQDGLRVERSQLRGAKIDSFEDHRIAMAFAVAGLFANGDTFINGAECVDVSFPRFFETLQGVVT